MSTMDPGIALVARCVTIRLSRSRQSLVSMSHRTWASPLRRASAATRLLVAPYGGRRRVIQRPVT
ncbi:hypothetical protein ACQPYK_40650 [Streptosporangium sp. CA-135522]|uniref:hypothetical protein n=1 Tax=Streptosporangium sp. CA-135522 TaxID=3240072 RepID=UPI003D8B0787